MKHKLTTITLMGAIVFASSCKKEIINGSGSVVTEDRVVNSFTGIDLSLSGTVNYIDGEDSKVELTGQQNVLDEIITEVSDGKLIIRLPENTQLTSYEPIVINITSRGANDFSIHGSGKIISDDTLRVTNSDFNISGSGEIHLAGLYAGDIDAKLSGSGTITVLGGSIETMNADIHGSGAVDMLGVETKSAKIYTSGSCDTKLHVTDYLEAHISGSSSVHYMGEPEINSDISGGGKLIRL